MLCYVILCYVCMYVCTYLCLIYLGAECHSGTYLVSDSVFVLIFDLFFEVVSETQLLDMPRQSLDYVTSLKCMSKHFET